MWRYGLLLTPLMSAMGGKQTLVCTALDKPLKTWNNDGMLWLVLAAHVTAARVNYSAPWFRNIPAAAWESFVRKPGYGLVLYRITVTPKGRLQDCKIEASSGSPGLDDLTCHTVLKGGGFWPAKWTDGTAVYDIWRQTFLWAGREKFDYSQPVDLEIQVDRLPSGLKSPLSLELNFAVDTNGSKSSCESPAKDADPALVSIACQQLLTSYPAVPAKDDHGTPVRSIQNAFVSFVTK